jgi:hypothetical protein
MATTSKNTKKDLHTMIIQSSHTPQGIKLVLITYEVSLISHFGISRITLQLYHTKI